MKREGRNGHLDVVDVYGALDAWDAVELPHIVLQVGHLMNEVAIALEVHLRCQQDSRGARHVEGPILSRCARAYPLLQP